MLNPREIFPDRCCAATTNSAQNGPTSSQEGIIMKRHIYAFDTPHAARAAIHQLHDCDIGDHAIALIAGSRTELEEIPRRYRDASTDFVPALGRGATVGAAVGLCTGLVALAIASLGIAASAWALVGCVIVGSLVGAWASAFTGASVPDEIRRKYADELTAGRILLVVTTRHADTDATLAHAMADRHDRHLVWQSEMRLLTT
jgi:hypothetical protein